MIDDKRISVLDRLIVQADFLTYRPHLYAYSEGWICRYKVPVMNCFAYGVGVTMREAYESARDHWRREERMQIKRRKHFPTVA